MKKKIYFILSFLLILMIGGCSKYEELNNLSIISNITITYKDGLYIVSMQEIIPQKGENKINYDYKYRTGSGKNLAKAFPNIIDHSPKKIYLRRVQNVIIDYKNRKKIMKAFLEYDRKYKNISREASIVLTKNDLGKVLKINSDYKYIDSVLKENKRTLYKASGIYKKKKRLRIPLIKINDKELIFSKFIYLQV